MSFLLLTVLQRNRNDVDVVRALSILRRKSQREIFLISYSIQIYSTLFYFVLTEERSSLIESKCEGSDETDGGDADFIDDNVDIRIDPEIANRIATHDAPRLSNEARTHLDRKPKMHRVIPLKTNKRGT